MFLSTQNNRIKIDEIKSRFDIVDVIGRDISLHYNGNGEYFGSVPPVGSTGRSLKVNQKLQLWNDTKNRKGGDVLDWIGRDFGDPRGSDFLKVLRIAAELAGIKLAELTEKELEAAKEKVEIHNLFSETAVIYHKNLTERPELYNYIMEKWSIKAETVDLLKIGYSTMSRDLSGLDEITLRKSGLVFVNDGKIGGEVFNGRIIFPYWNNGKAVYLIGRETSETPAVEREKGMKYKKLLVHNEKHEYVSPCVQNSYFYGEDSLRGADYCIITEGVADCIVMLQAGFPCISPVTVQFRDKDYHKLLNLTKGLKRVFICNDNELNAAGLKGALSTAEALENEKIEARLITLPKPDSIDKIDIADYMKEHSPEDFKGLMGSSVRLWQYKLNSQVISQVATSFDRIRAFRSFILTDLDGMSFDEWEVFVNNEVAQKFQLKAKDIKTTVLEIAKERHRENRNEVSNPEGEAPDEKTEYEARLSNYPENIRDSAYKVLKDGDAFEFMLETWNLRHVGDKNIGENCLCAVASTYILNTRGLHVKPSGESGKGKSDAIETVLELLPEHKYISGSMSSKSLYYHRNLKSATIIYSDDAHFTDDTIATLKQSTSNFQKPVKHRTVVNQEYAEYTIPERCSFWYSTIDGIPDEQLANRFLNADVDGSKEQDIRVYNHIKDKELDLNLPIDDDVLICRCIFDILDKEQYNIKIPYINAIEWTNIENRRNFPKFLDILRSITFFKVMQREKLNGYYLSDIEDFYRALSIYKGTAKNNATNLTDQELKVLKFIEGQPATIQNLMHFLNVSRARVMQILNGKDGKSGMLAKVPQLNKIDRSETAEGINGGKITTRGNVYEYNGPKLGFEIYDSVATINHEKAEEERSIFMQKLSEKSVTTVTPCNPSVISEGVTLKPHTIDRINSNVTLKMINVIQGNCDNTFLAGITDSKINQEKLGVSYSENLGYSITLDDKSCHLNMVSECNSTVDGGVTYGCIGYTQENDESRSEAVVLLKSALMKYSKTHYNSTVEDVPRFVSSFNKKTPAFKQRLEYETILEVAEKLHKCGQL